MSVCVCVYVCACVCVCALVRACVSRLTDRGEAACEAEVVHCVEGQQVEQELLPLLLTQQERMRLVELPGGRDVNILYTVHEACTAAWR